MKPPAQPRTGVPTNVVEAVVAFLVLVMGLVVISGQLEAGLGLDHRRPGRRLLSLLHRPDPVHLRRRHPVPGAVRQERNTEIFVDSEQLKRVLSVLVPALVYVLAVQFLGLYVASAIYIALFMIVLGKYSRVKSVIVGAG